MDLCECARRKEDKEITKPNERTDKKVTIARGIKNSNATPLLVLASQINLSICLFESESSSLKGVERVFAIASLQRLER